LIHCLKITWEYTQEIPKQDQQHHDKKTNGEIIKMVSQKLGGGGANGLMVFFKLLPKNTPEWADKYEMTFRTVEFTSNTS